MADWSGRLTKSPALISCVDRGQSAMARRARRVFGISRPFAPGAGAPWAHHPPRPSLGARYRTRVPDWPAVEKGGRWLAVVGDLLPPPSSLRLDCCTSCAPRRTTTQVRRPAQTRICTSANRRQPPAPPRLARLTDDRHTLTSTPFPPRTLPQDGLCPAQVPGGPAQLPQQGRPLREPARAYVQGRR